MTACAMTVGMVPMALALEQGSQMQAPLGRAVIGGLVMSTFATLLVLPSIFALVIGRKAARSPSIYPDDPESMHYDPLVFAQRRDRPPPRQFGARMASRSTTATSRARDRRTRRTTTTSSPSSGRILDEARSKRHDMVTHYTVDDLRAALGFAKPEVATDEAAAGRRAALPRPNRSAARSGHGRRWRPCARRP